MKVHQGQIVVSSVTVLADHEDIKAWLVECDSKYPEFIHTHSALMLYGGDRTLGCNDASMDVTEVTFDIPDGWITYVDGGGYSFAFIAIDPTNAQRKESIYVHDLPRRTR